MLTQVNFSSFIVDIFIVLIGLKYAWAVLEWFTTKIGLEFKSTRKKREEHELIISIAKRLEYLENQREMDVQHSIRHDKELKDGLEKLTEMVIDKNVEDMRWEILDFASALTAGRNFSKEQFDHVIGTHNKYEEYILENKRSNGQVTNSMDIINQCYKEKMKLGFYK
ncbi:hypothetical protein [Clostridium sp. chh4-2]|uniref:hypothetical protein n=1 Tax=Clostridium sp. chh4-2 TaxID=2067550 RepID=UPI0015E19CA4|nr:hypothetical protein [Clostridium sp. chh4-2]